MRKEALEGINVVGFLQGGVGPIVTTTLGMYGATVVMVESIKRPMDMRASGSFKDGKPNLDKSFMFNSDNPDKYGMCLDLKHPRAKPVAEKLIKWADIIVDNYRPGVMESWGIGYEDAKKIKPDIIMISLSQQGHTGPHRRVAGYGPQLSGLVGFPFLTGWPDRDPSSVGPLPDMIVPRFGTVALLAALDYRKRTGKGQYIDLSQYEVSLHFLSQALLDYSVNNVVEKRDGNKCLFAAPHAVYRCKGDDKWCAIVVFTEEEWNKFCEVIGNPSWTKEPRFQTVQNRKDNEDDLNKLIEQWTVQYENHQIMDVMQKAGIQAGAVRDMGEAVLGCPQMNYRKYWRTTQHPEIGKVIVPGSSYIMSKTPYKIDKPAPCFGEHTEYVCNKLLGITDGEFVDLMQAGVFQ